MEEKATIFGGQPNGDGRHLLGVRLRTKTSSPYKDKELAKLDTTLEYWICDGRAVFLD